jgi:endonuclease YncB( thermonuclease family)
MPEPIPAYVRNATFVSNHDGDTVTLALDHGKFPTSRSVTECEIRVKGLYCPELNEAGGAEAADFTHEVLSKAQRIVAQTYKGSFARTVADVWVDGRLLTDVVVEAGFGKRTQG